MAKKLDIKSPLVANDGGGNPPPILTPEEADRATYGGIDTPPSNKIIARSVMLTDIKPDVKQPRRIIPASIRKGWTGDVSKIPVMLSLWRIEAEKALGESLDPVALVSKFTDGREADKDILAIADEYLALCALAASINRDGLANPIQITGRNTPHTIVTGERRYMAHWLLKVLLGPKWESIPAVVVNEPDVWLQAAENGNRRSLNAIGFARQLALLIMEMYLGDDGVKFDDISFFSHEREFYAQVANGNIWRIKKGLGERVLQVTGLKSIAQVNQYRGLLSISNELWDEADANNWTEGRIRDTLRPRDTSTVVDVYTGEKKVNGVYTSTAVNISERQPTPAQVAYNKFADAMRGVIRRDVHRSKVGNGLFARGINLVFVWWRHDFNGFEIIVESGGHLQAGRMWDMEAVIQQMYGYQSDISRWQIMARDKWDAMVNPPTPRQSVPPPQPTPSFDARKAQMDIMGDDDDNDDVMMDDDGDVPIIHNHPFVSNGLDMPPHDMASAVPSDARYVQSRMLLRSFLGMMVSYMEAFGGDKAEVVQLRDLTPDAVANLKKHLSNDEIAQMMSNWQNLVTDALVEVQNNLNDVLAVVWADVEGKR